jgi:hypothetical protein
MLLEIPVLLYYIPFHDVIERSDTGDLDAGKVSSDSPEVGIVVNTQPVNLVVDNLSNFLDDYLTL